MDPDGKTSGVFGWLVQLDADANKNPDLADLNMFSNKLGVVTFGFTFQIKWFKQYCSELSVCISQQLLWRV